MSVQLGLHKDSYNYLNRVNQLNKERNLAKLKQLYDYGRNEDYQLTEPKLGRNKSLMNTVESDKSRKMTRNEHSGSASRIDFVKKNNKSSSIMMHRAKIQGRSRLE